jgi:hypothetical protein
MSNSEATTKPTLETIMDRIKAQGDEMRAGFQTIAARLEEIEIRLDRVQGIVLGVRADFREFRSSFKQPTLDS